MSDRIRQVVLGLIFWIVFAIPAALCILLQPVSILLYALGSDNIRAWTYRTGKALDQFNNAAWFGGLPQETISSHTGRWYQRAIDAAAQGEAEMMPVIPLRFRLIKWLTDKFEKDHVIRAIEEPFKDQPL